MTTPDELTDLEGVIEHPGWARIRSLVQHEFGPSGQRYAEELERVMNVSASAGDHAAAVTSMQVIVKARREIERFFASIEARVRDLQNAKVPTVTMSRRGSL
jgi:hypothetical protein